MTLAARLSWKALDNPEQQPGHKALLPEPPRYRHQDHQRKSRTVPDFSTIAGISSLMSGGTVTALNNKVVKSEKDKGDLTAVL